MAKLVLSLNGNLINQYFTDRPELRIGSSADNDIVVDDPSCRPFHAVIRCVGEDHILETCDASAGLIVNGNPLERRILQHLDTLQFGRHHLRYMNPRVAAKNNLDYTMLIDALDKDGELAICAGNAADAPNSNIRFPAGYVQVLRGVDVNQGQFVTLDRVVSTFGTPGTQLMVITRRPAGFFLSHVEGTEMPRINGRSIAGKASQLNDGDVIELTGWELEFHLGERPSRAALETQETPAEAPGQ